MIQLPLLEKLVSSAETRRMDYFSYFHDEEIFGLIDLTFQEKYGVQIQTEDFDAIIEGSLQKRGINYLAELQHLPRNKAAILGETYHFVHKFTLRNYEYRNPLPILKLTFEALEPIDDEYAAKFLYGILSSIDRDSTKWRSDIPRVVNFFEKILPNLLNEYKSALIKIEEYKENGGQYSRKKESVDSFYRKSLGISFELLAESAKRKLEFGWDSFERERQMRGIRQDFKTIYVNNRL